MPVAEFGGDRQPFTESLVIQERRLHAVVIRSQTAERIAGRKIRPHLESKIAVLSSEHGVLEAGAHVAYSVAIGQGSRYDWRKLDKTYRSFYKYGNAPVRGVFQVQLK